jgi:DNA-binding transcriptional LysR family regulator
MALSERILLFAGVLTDDAEFPCQNPGIPNGKLPRNRAFGIPEKRETAKRQSHFGDDHLRMIDLNVFRVFNAMIEFRSVLKASQALSITPSAVSHALNRLRQSIGDELFVPSRFGMRPTQRALALASAARAAYQMLELAVRGDSPAPVELPRTLRIVATDYACVVLLPPLVKRLAKGAPNLELQVASNHIDAVRQLEEGQADLVIGSFSKLPESVRRKTLLREDEVIVVRARHPLTGSQLTKEKLSRFAHIVVQLIEENNNGADRQGNYLVERALQEFQQAKISPTGRATVSVPDFAAIISFLQMSDMVAIVPRRLASSAAANAPLFMLDPPYPAVAIEIEMVWHQTSDGDRTIRWLLNELVASVGDLQ